jgi:hypothetical protein
LNAQSSVGIVQRDERYANNLKLVLIRDFLRTAIGMIIPKEHLRSLDRITWLICFILRVDLDLFIQGAPLAQLSKEFQRIVAKLFFMPVAERSIEVPMGFKLDI